jgi:peptide deformylase
MKELWETCVKDLEILRQRVPRSSNEDCEKAIKEIREVLATHDSSNCFGLAANQVGLNIRACFLKVPYHYFKSPPTKQVHVVYEFHNPDIVEWKGNVINQEWCYSLDRQSSYIVQRYKEVTIKDDKNGITVLKGVPAYAAQHEVDHLNGKMICDKGKAATEFMKVMTHTPNKNAPCSCGSGRKYKRCCAKKKQPAK